jgi:phosphate transport system substrate-binding protein
MKLHVTLSSLAAVVVGAVILTFTAQALAADTVLQAAGCKTEYFLLKDLSDAYNAKTGARLLLGDTGNKKAVELLLDQKIDVTFTCKPIQKLTKGLQLDPDAVYSWSSVAIAKDPIVVVSNSNNGVRNITSEQLTRLFQGKIANWSELGGNDVPVVTAHMDPKLESGVVMLFKEFTMGLNGQLDEKGRLGEGPSMLGNYVSLTQGAVTFMAFNSYEEKYGDILAIDGVLPTRENILDGSYGLAATYYITTDGRSSEAVADFVNFIKSEQGKQATELNFISISE